MSESSALQEFLTRHATAYDPVSDDYERPPFAVDIKEGKNHPIYNAHAYHTKVPPRSIIPYILHYTRPGDLVLDPFCGSGMTGVAAQMCADPPLDLLDQFSELRDCAGPRACILNDLSPAACHIAYNYNEPVDVELLRREFHRIKAEVQDEFNWLYGTEHYEPAIGPYSPDNLASHNELFSDVSATGQKWTLISLAEVEQRLGYPVTKLARDHKWGEADLAKIERWVCIPATIQYTIWSDVYKCEGFISMEEPTGKISTRGKNIGKPISKKKRVARGCGKNIIIWDAAVTPEGEVLETFECPSCPCRWKKMQLRRQCSVAVETNLVTTGIRSNKGRAQFYVRRYERRISQIELTRLQAISEKAIPYWIPTTEMDPKGPRYRRDALQVRNIKKVTDFWTHRNLWAYASLWDKVRVTTTERIRDALHFALTGITFYVTKKQAWGTGGGGLSGQLFVSSFPLEKNTMDVWERKVKQLLDGYAAARKTLLSNVVVTCGSATKMQLPDASIDYIFTDPPFGSNIYYSEPNLLWEAWLGEFTDTKEEAVVHRTTDGGTKRLPDYANLMLLAFAEMFRVLKPGRWCTVEFNNSDGTIFEAVRQAIRGAGFEIVNMLLLDKTQKSFQQVKGAGLGVVDKDVLFNLRKPSVITAEYSSANDDLERKISKIIREHLLTLPERMEAEPAKYNEEHRTTATINSILMNALIPCGVSVELLNLPFIESICGRYFRKVGQHWYLRGESVGSTGDRLIEEEVEIRDELSAIHWLRQKLRSGSKLAGELNPLWMRAIGLLPAETSRSLNLEELLSENFWRDADTNRWREPAPEERDKMNDDRSLRALHDAERFINGTLRRPTTDAERAGWIDVLFHACRAIEDEEEDALPALRGFAAAEAYVLITRLFQGILRDRLADEAWRKVEKQATAASRKIAFRANEQNVKATKPRGPEGGQEHFDFGKA
jgi:DNA modification methylase